MAQPTPETVAACLTLSALEDAVLHELALGRTNAVIAKRVRRSPAGVMNAVNRIREKFCERFPDADPPSRVELAFIAVAIQKSRQPAVQPE